MTTRKRKSVPSDVIDIDTLNEHIVGDYVIQYIIQGGEPLYSINLESSGSTLALGGEDTGSPFFLQKVDYGNKRAVYMCFEGMTSGYSWQSYRLVDFETSLERAEEIFEGGEELKEIICFLA